MGNIRAKRDDAVLNGSCTEVEADASILPRASAGVLVATER